MNEVTKEYLSQIGRELVNIVKFKLVKGATRYDRNRDSLADSNLINSFEYVITQDGLDVIANSYWIYVDGGRKSGHRPPFSALYLWALRYKIKPLNGQTVVQMIGAIQTAIYKNGIKPRPFVLPALESADKVLNPYGDKFATIVINNAFGG